jgi:ABC-2 type transport system permease protein
MRRELCRIRTRPRYGLLVLVLPLVSFGLAWGLFSNQYPHDLPVAVVDQDHSALSRKLTDYMDAASVIHVAFRPSDPAQAKDLVLRGMAYAVIILPSGLERDIKHGLGGDVIGYYNAQTLLPGSLIYTSLNTVVATVSAGIQLTSRLKRGETRETAMAHLEPVNVDRHVLFNPQLNYVYFLAAALCPTFLQIFVMMTMVMALGEEFKESTVPQWFRTAGGKTLTAVLGKMVFYFIPFSLIGMIMLAVVINGFGLPLRGSLAGLIPGTLLLILAYQACGLFVVIFSPSLRMSLSVTSFYSGTAFAFVGLTFPQPGMPALAKAWSNILPLTHYLHLFQDQTIHGADGGAIMPNGLIMALFILAPWLFIAFFKRHATRRRYWGWL